MGNLLVCFFTLIKGWAPRACWQMMTRRSRHSLRRSEKRAPYRWRKMQKAEMPWTFTGQGLGRLSSLGVLEPPQCGDLAPGQKDLLFLLIPGNGGARTPIKDGIQGAGVPIHIGTCRAAGGGWESHAPVNLMGADWCAWCMDCLSFCLYFSFWVQHTVHKLLLGVRCPNWC